MGRFNKNVLLVTIFSIFIIAVIIGCSSDKPTENEDNGSTIETITVTPSVSQASSLSYIGLTGIPDGNDSVFAVVTSVASAPTGKNSTSNVITSIADAQDTAYSLVFLTDSGAYLVAPLNPSDPTGGGTVQVLITDVYTFVSEPFTLVIDSLPEAPGEAASIIALLKQTLDHKLRLSKTSRDSLRNYAPADMPLNLISLFVAYDGLDNPDNPNSLQAFVDGTSPMGGTSPDFELVDRVMALTGYREYLQDYVIRLDSLDTLSFRPVVMPKLNESVSQSSSPNACIPGPDLGISNCADLAQAMQEHAALERAARSAADKVLADIAANSLLLIGMLPGGGTASAVAGGILWVDAKIAEGQSNLFPSEFVDGATSFDPSVTQFMEDFTEPGKWTEFKVTATSKGWKLDKLILESILQALSAKGGYDSFNSPPVGLDEFVDGLDETVESAMIGTATDQIVNELADESGIIEICPYLWSNIDCVDQNYSDVVVSSGPLDLDEPGRTYEPTDLGSSILRIETNGEFGDERTGIAASISTKAIEIFIDPFQAKVDTMKRVAFSFRVENAEDKRVSVSLDNGGSLIVADHVSATIETPNTPWNPPLELHVTSISESGLRANSTEERKDTAPIIYDVEGVAIISPNSICVKKNKSQDFTVSLTSGSIDSVRWEIEPADFGNLSNETGTTTTYNAPSDQSGHVTIRATVNGKSTATADVSVAACVCTWIFEAVGSGYNYSYTGEWAPAENLGALTISMLTINDPNVYFPFVGLAVYNFNGIDTYQSENVSLFGLDDMVWTYMDTTKALPTIEITDYLEGDFVEGVAYGELHNRIGLPPNETYEYISFSVTFRAEFQNLIRPQCVDD